MFLNRFVISIIIVVFAPLPNGLLELRFSLTSMERARPGYYPFDAGPYRMKVAEWRSRPGVFEAYISLTSFIASEMKVLVGKPVMLPGCI